MSGIQNLITNNPALDIVVIGAKNSGKSCLVNRFISNEFQEFFVRGSDSPVLDAAVYSERSVTIGETLFCIKLCDTSSDQKYDVLLPTYCRGARAAIVCYSIGSIESYKKAKRYVDDLKEREVPKVVFLVATMLDRFETRAVSESESQSFANSNEITLVETSAKTGDNVNELFSMVASEILKDGSDHTGSLIKQLTTGFSVPSGRTSQVYGLPTHGGEPFTQAPHQSTLYPKVRSQDTNDEESPDWQAPVWVLDSAARSCSDCEGNFTVVNRKHHCRGCGNIFCANCSAHKVFLPNNNSLQRVCHKCFLKFKPS